MIEVLELVVAVGRGVAAVAEGVATVFDIAEALTSLTTDPKKEQETPAAPGPPEAEAAGPTGGNRATGTQPRSE